MNNKKSRSSGGSRRRPPFDEGAGSPQNASRGNSTAPRHDNNRQPNHKPGHTNGGASHFHGMYDKNMNLAREAMNDNDRASAEYYFQNAEHYLRMLNERRRHQAIKNQQSEKEEAEQPAPSAEETHLVDNSQSE